jgi:hypothetical protein
MSLFLRDQDSFVARTMHLPYSNFFKKTARPEPDGFGCREMGSVTIFEEMGSVTIFATRSLGRYTTSIRYGYFCSPYGSRNNLETASSPDAHAPSMCCREGLFYYMNCSGCKAFLQNANDLFGSWSEASHASFAEHAKRRPKANLEPTPYTYPLIS